VALSFWQRLWLAFILPWKLLADGALAARVQPLALPAPAAAPAAPETSSALQLLSLLQREGRFIDFLQEDVTGFSDADVGAAARVVHSGCKRAIAGALKLDPIRTEVEGAPVTLEKGFDPARTRITGNVVGEPPFKGRLAHHGWLVREIHLPTLAAGHDPLIVAPAEVEL